MTPRTISAAGRATARWVRGCLGWLGAAACVGLNAQTFRLPTANRTLLTPGHQAGFYTGTVGRPWTSGTFGCVRTGGAQLHEGLDIRSVQRDRQGEPADPVMATADGTVAYINSHASLSAYGIYVIVRHGIDGMEVYSLYAHLSRIADGLRVGQPVRAGQTLAIMGRTANTRQSISRERAHLHFELCLLINEHFPQWHRRTYRDGVNDHGLWNGLNLAGLDPESILLEQHRRGPRFSLLNVVRCQTELCRVVVRHTRFPWLQRYPALVQRNRLAERDGVAGYEIALNFNGIPFHLVPRAPSEIRRRAPIHLLSVNESEQRLRPCRGLVRKISGRWELTPKGVQFLELLTFP
ncbi:MAG: M23 family metallopeptidase [Verrucomicrobia bacterium]|nr:M23 family metallopeptidase [Verrucomicrobiota bacterium]